MNELAIATRQHAEFVEITERIQQVVAASGVQNGTCVVVVPHTTAGITINENADPDVVTDLLYALEKAVPWRDPNYRHGEGNTAAHVKAAMLGHSVTLLVRGGRLQFGTWQGVFFCEFDGPRQRKAWVQVT